VEVYSLPADAQKPSRSRLFAGRLFLFAVFFLGYFALDYFWPASHRIKSLAGSAIRALVWSALMIVFGFFSSRRRQRYDVTVDGDLIVGKGLGGSRKVHRGEIRTIIERRPNFLTDGGLMLSERGRFGMFMWGGVWIPRALPEYEYLKSVAEMWKAEEPAN
jgi:hypothetical protein